MDRSSVNLFKQCRMIGTDLLAERAGSPENLPLHSTFRPEVSLRGHGAESNCHPTIFPAGEPVDQIRTAGGSIGGHDPTTGNPNSIAISLNSGTRIPRTPSFTMPLLPRCSPCTLHDNIYTVPDTPR
jgi:hypothetical protein